MIIEDVVLYGGYVLGSYFIGYCSSFLIYLFRRLANIST